ncbi:MAG: hypothetical protein RIC56_19300 [Pseudomonadales bacterium]
MDKQLTFSQLLGNYGEFIGGIAVLATLAYLAYQLRQGTRALERSDVRAIMERFDAFFVSLGDPKIAALWLEGQAAELKAESAQHLSYLSLVTRYVYATQNLWESAHQGIVSAPMWTRQATTFAVALSTPGGAKCWEQIKVGLAEDFVDEVEELRSAVT